MCVYVHKGTPVYEVKPDSDYRRFRPICARIIPPDIQSKKKIRPGHQSVSMFSPDNLLIGAFTPGSLRNLVPLHSQKKRYES